MCKLPNKSGLVLRWEALLSSLSSEVTEHATARRRSPLGGEREAAAVWWEMRIQSFLRGLRLCVQAENDVTGVESGGGSDRAQRQRASWSPAGAASSVISRVARH